MNMDTNYSDLSLSKISSLMGIPDDEPDERIPLSIWIDNIKDYKIKELTDGDIAKLIRQEIFLDYIVPEAINRIEKNPLAGSLGDGEILESFSMVSVDIWKSEGQKFCKELKLLLEEFLMKLQSFKLDIPYHTERFDDLDQADLAKSIKKAIENLNLALQ